ncbi:calmodulin-binding transcription activator 4-like [Zingiber officinale]|uniref:calmodulin-binding transcription activator 4-like n=1 Tax=Zingiber officinale TaxID=94328 RepID=UPI001C4BD212|nr:calmodulin-binding transcription activator 4-like [Zingiber officinale]
MQHGFDIDVLRQEAQKRWLKASEVLFILKDYKRYPLTPEPPHLPPSGSLFLFNRKVLRFFRKDGHAWRRKKDGRTIGEAHERLKVGNVDTLSCYYAHGEQNPYFQRRSYWMLDPEYEHIVLVHYREVDEGRYVSGSTSNFSMQSYSSLNHTSSIINADKGYTSGTTVLYEPSQSPYSQGSTEEVSSKFVLENFDTNDYTKFDTLENSDKNSQPEVNQALRSIATQLSLDADDNSIYFQENLPEYLTENDDIQILGHFSDGPSEVSLAHENLLEGSDRRHQISEVGKQQNYATAQLQKSPGDHKLQQNQPLCLESPSWTDVLQNSKSVGMDSHGRSSNFLATNGIPDSSISTDPLPTFSGRENISTYSFGPSENLSSYTAEDSPNDHEISETDLRLQLSATRRFLLGFENSIESPITSSQLKMFGEHNSSLGGTFEVIKENSSDWIGAVPISLGNSTCLADFSSIFDQSQFGASLETDLSLTVSQKQRFTIREVSPEWAFSYESTKVIITGDFLCNPLESSWAVMFGDIEVPLDIVQEGVLRCQAPQHNVGKVTLCITSGNRESCSEVREFEFRAKLTTSNYIDPLSTVGTAKDSEEISLLARLSQMLLCEYDSSTIAVGSVDNQEKSRKLKATHEHWKQIIEALGYDNSLDIKDWIMQELLKDKLLNWLSTKHQNNKQAGCLLSKQEQGIIHLISGLGYEWALGPILEHGVGINFRDANGWAALHWAAHCSREKMVAALLAAGASAGLVTDPTAQDPVGKTPGFLASARGYKGLAGYLSEVALANHLSSLTVEENEISKGSAEVEAERAIESISQRSVKKHGETEDELSLKDSLAAVRNAALAAARIQAAFRAHSFRKRQQNAALSLSYDDYGLTPGDIQGFSAMSRIHRPSYFPQDQNFDRAALSIQKKYRGWKGRRDFVTLRLHTVKIQAHVRGHQVRKKYREIIWTVGIIEKVILRWRRKGAGLRGFRAEPEIANEEEDDDIAKVFRRQKVDAAVDQAVSRVLSMVDSPDARQQYRRMLERYREAKAELSNSDEATSELVDDCEVADMTLFTDSDQSNIYWTT